MLATLRQVADWYFRLCGYVPEREVEDRLRLAHLEADRERIRRAELEDCLLELLADLDTDKAREVTEHMSIKREERR